MVSRICTAGGCPSNAQFNVTTSKNPLLSKIPQDGKALGSDSYCENLIGESLAAGRYARNIEQDYFE
jgi:hypothetical protein